MTVNAQHSKYGIQLNISALLPHKPLLSQSQCFFCCPSPHSFLLQPVIEQRHILLGGVKLVLCFCQSEHKRWCLNLLPFPAFFGCIFCTLYPWLIVISSAGVFFSFFLQLALPNRKFFESCLCIHSYSFHLLLSSLMSSPSTSLTTLRIS